MLKRLFRRNKKQAADNQTDLTQLDSPVSYEDKSQDLSTSSLDSYRKKILKHSRKYHSWVVVTNQRLVSLSFLIIIALIITLMGYSYFRLYRGHDYSGFMHNLTQVVPFPVARIGNTLVAYKDYLSHLKRLIYYFESQQKVDFGNPQDDDIVTLAELQVLALKRALEDAYAEKIAQQYDLSVSDAEIDAKLDLLRDQNKLGYSQLDSENVLDDFWQLDLRDYRENVRQVLLRQKIAKELDKEFKLEGRDALTIMNTIQDRLEAGDSFENLAQEFSEDVNTALNGGEYRFLLSLEEHNEKPEILKVAFETPVGQVSPIFDAGDRLEILKVISQEPDNKLKVAHIMIRYTTFDEVLKTFVDQGGLPEPVIYIEGVEYQL